MLDLIKILTVDGQKNSKIYSLIDKLFMLLNDENWKSNYVFWELNLLKYIGFDLNLIDYCKYDKIEKQVLLVTQKDAMNQYPGSTSPFTHDLNPSMPQVSSPYSRNWKALGLSCHTGTV